MNFFKFNPFNMLASMIDKLMALYGYINHSVT